MDLLRRCRLASMVGGLALACLASSVVASAPSAQAFILRPVRRETRTPRLLAGSACGAEGTDCVERVTEAVFLGF